MRNKIRLFFCSESWYYDLTVTEEGLNKIVFWESRLSNMRQALHPTTACDWWPERECWYLLAYSRARGKHRPGVFLPQVRLGFCVPRTGHFHLQGFQAGFLPLKTFPNYYCVITRALTPALHHTETSLHGSVIYELDFYGEKTALPACPEKRYFYTSEKQHFHKGI